MSMRLFYSHVPRGPSTIRPNRAITNRQGEFTRIYVPTHSETSDAYVLGSVVDARSIRFCPKGEGLDTCR